METQIIGKSLEEILQDLILELEMEKSSVEEFYIPVIMEAITPKIAQMCIDECKELQQWLDSCIEKVKEIKKMLSDKGDKEKLIKAFSNVLNLFEHKKKFAYYQDFMSLDSSTKSNKKTVLTNINSIVFSDVSFAYDTDEIIKDFSLEINAGTSLAIIGPNGAGKSTVIKLLLGYYSVTKGEILINNKNINNYDKCDYSQLFSFVGQSAELFEMSIAENILLKKCETDLEKEQVYEVLQQVGMLDKILSLENNIYTVLGKEFTDEGVLFSGGEMQKLCIARALAQKNKVLIVDEPSSHIDPIAENEIFSLLDKIKEDKVVIFITHNIKKAAKADNIVWLEEGKIIEQGKHEEMLNYNGKYFSSYNSSYQILMEN